MTMEHAILEKLREKKNDTDERLRQYGIGNFFLLLSGLGGCVCGAFVYYAERLVFQVGEFALVATILFFGIVGMVVYVGVYGDKRTGMRAGVCEWLKEELQKSAADLRKKLAELPGPGFTQASSDAALIADYDLRWRIAQHIVLAGIADDLRASGYGSVIIPTGEELARIVKVIVEDSVSLSPAELFADIPPAS